MVQKISEEKGYMFLHFGEPPAEIGRITFVSCLAYRDDRILFCKWRDTGIWALPGGRLEPGEAAEAAAHRELFEETGATWRGMEVLCYLHCFMFDLEYWGIAYFGEIRELGSPLDLNEVSEAKLLPCYPKNSAKRNPFENQSRALYTAALCKLSAK